MNTEQCVICKLGGYSEAQPEIISSYPHLTISPENSRELILKCLPIGSHVGDFILDKHDNHNLLSYVFKIEEHEFRDDLLSFSILLDKKLNTEVYKFTLKEFFSDLEKKRMLSELILKQYQKTIFDGFNLETDIEIENYKITLSEFFKNAKTELIKPKPKTKGSFF